MHRLPTVKHTAVTNPENVTWNKYEMRRYRVFIGLVARKDIGNVNYNISKCNTKNTVTTLEAIVRA